MVLTLFSRSQTTECQYSLYTLELGRCRYFRSVSVFGIFSVFQSWYRYRYRYFEILRYRCRYRYFYLDRYYYTCIEKSWSQFSFSDRSLSCPGFQTVSNACSVRTDFCRKYIHANLSFLDGEISMNDDHEFMTTWILPGRLRQSKDSDQWTVRE